MSYLSEDMPGGYTTFEYDDAGNLIQYNEYSATGSMNYYHILETDFDGNEIDYVYTPEGKLHSYSIDEYDENKNLIKSSMYNSEGILLKYSIYEYDDEGNQISEHYYTEEAESEE